MIFVTLNERLTDEVRKNAEIMRQRNAYRDALAAIQEVLDDPSHGAYHSDLWSMVNTVLQTGKRGT